MKNDIEKSLFSHYEIHKHKINKDVSESKNYNDLLKKHQDLGEKIREMRGKNVPEIEINKSLEELKNVYKEIRLLFHNHNPFSFPM